MSGTRLVESALARRGNRESIDDTDVFDADMFRQSASGWWLDRAMPSGAGKYLLATFAVCHAVWMLGLLLRLVSTGFENAGAEALDFVKNPQWQIQPLLLFIHFVALRLFKGIFARRFDRAFRFLDVPQDELQRARRWLLGTRVNLIALAIAAPFIVYEAFFFFPSNEFLEKFGLADRTLAAWFLLAVWSFEWWMFGYYAWLLAASATLNSRILRRHQFHDSVDLVLTERQYRGLFNLVTQSGSLVFFYALIHVVALWYGTARTDVSTSYSDLTAIGILVLLLVYAFSMTFGAVRRTLKGRVNEALESLETSYRSSREKLSGMKDEPGIEDDIKRIQVQLKMQLALQQHDYLHKKFFGMGRKEALGMVFKMLAPVGSVLAKAMRWGSILAAIGLGGAAALLGSGDDAKANDTPANEPDNAAHSTP